MVSKQWSVGMTLLIITNLTHASPLDTQDFFKTLNTSPENQLKITDSNIQIHTCEDIYKLYQKKHHLQIANSLTTNDYIINRDNIAKCLISKDIQTHSLNTKASIIRPALIKNLPNFLPAEVFIPLSNSDFARKGAAVKQRKRLAPLVNLKYKEIAYNKKASGVKFTYEEPLPNQKTQALHYFHFIGTAKLQKSQKKIYILNYSMACTQGTCRSSDYYLLTENNNGNFEVVQNYRIR